MDQESHKSRTSPVDTIKKVIYSLIDYNIVVCCSYKYVMVWQLWVKIGEIIDVFSLFLFILGHKYNLIKVIYVYGLMAPRC